ncbi:hypothetical protein [Shewanella maritima]|uniref:hypothetical protein n=1 Tax=Shewanella maritima TaxID=2520507 RepID=UPI003735EBAE
MKLRTIAALSSTLLVSSAYAADVEVYLEQNISSNATDHGVYTTEAGAKINTSENGYVTVQFDDQGWLAAGYGHRFGITEQASFTLYGELGKWDEAKEILVEAIFDYQVNENINVFAGYGFSQIEQTSGLMGGDDIDSHKFIAGAHMTFHGFDLNYEYTHTNTDGNNGYIHGPGNSFWYMTESFRANEHEVILSKKIGDWRPYLKYTYFNTSEGNLGYGYGQGIGDSNEFAPIDNDHVWTLGVSYTF